ncbi:MAG: ABC transporter permease [Nitrososphaeria archaeon]
MASFKTYLIKRIILALVVIYFVITITFILSHVVPSDPAELYVGPKATAEQREKAIKELGLNQPIYIQYLRYFQNLVNGDLGKSLRAHTPVLHDILTYLPATLEIVVLANIVALIVGVAFGSYSALKKDMLADHLIRIVSVGGVSIPSFWFALITQLVFFGILGIFPLDSRLSSDIQLFNPIHTITGFYTIDALITGNIVALVDSVRHIILPAFVLATYPIGLVTRMVRSMMVEVLNENYIRFAKANGFKDNLIYYKYALKNALTPALMALGLSFAYSITGAFLVEVIFSWPGLGTYTVNAILENDYPAILGVTIFGTIFYVFINLFLDILQAYLDPRVRLQ